MTHPIVPVLALVFSSCLWGLSWLPLKALNSLGFEGIVLILSGQLILAFLFFPSGFKVQYLRSHGKFLLGIFLAGGSAILCFTYALIYGDVIRVMVLFYLLPVWGVIGGRIFLGEHVDWVRWLGVSSAILGAFFILGGPVIFDAPPSWIDLIAFCSGLFFAANNLFFRGLDAVPLSTKLLAMFLGCCTLCLITLIVSDQPTPQGVPLINYVWLIVYALTWLLVANYLSQWAVTKMEAGRSSIIMIFELFAAVFSAMLIGGETMSLIEGIGGGLVVLAAFSEAFRTPKDDSQTSSLRSI